MRIFGFGIDALSAALIIYYGIGIFLAIWGANKAKNKGYAYWVFLLVGLFIPMIPALVAECLPTREIAVQEPESKEPFDRYKGITYDRPSVFK